MVASQPFPSTERDDQMATEGDGHPGKGVEPDAGASALPESRDDGLRRAHALGQRTLGESCFGAQVVDQLAKRQVLSARTSGATLRRRPLSSSQREWFAIFDPPIKGSGGRSRPPDHEPPEVEGVEGGSVVAGGDGVILAPGHHTFGVGSGHATDGARTSRNVPGRLRIRTRAGPGAGCRRSGWGRRRSARATRRRSGTARARAPRAGRRRRPAAAGPATPAWTPPCR